jgi:hypothetical protein
MTDAETTEAIYKRLSRRFAPPKFASVREVRLGTGYDDYATGRIDFLAVSAARGAYVYGVEVKASRSDFLKDLKSVAKQKALRSFANFFYYAAPKGLIDPNELPEWAGLMEMTNTSFYTKTQAPLTERSAPTWSFVAALIRRLDYSQKPVIDGKWVKPDFGEKRDAIKPIDWSEQSAAIEAGALEKEGDVSLKRRIEAEYRVHNGRID